MQLRGVDRSGTEYACIQGWGFFDSPHPDRIDDPAMIAAIVSWGINAVRVPLNEDCWLGLHMAHPRFGGRALSPDHRRGTCTALNAAGLYVILDLHWVAPGRAGATGQLPMADADHAPRSGARWRGPFSGDHELVFDLFNEPTGSAGGAGATAARSGPSGSAPAYRTAGMQALVDAVRSTGATQPLALGGLQVRRRPVAAGPPTSPTTHATS